MGDDGGLQDLSIPRGEEAEFTCNFIEGDNDVTIKWKIDDVDHNCSEVAMETESVYNCSTGDSQSVLQVKNSSKLLIGDHSVQCVLNQNIPEDFQEDDTFDENFNFLTTRIATLTITDGPPSSLGECRSCDSHVITYTCTYVFIASINQRATS